MVIGNFAGMSIRKELHYNVRASLSHLVDERTIYFVFRDIYNDLYQYIRNRWLWVFEL